MLLFIGCEEILKHNVKIKNGLENNFNYINCSKIKEGVSYLKKDENVVIIIINATDVKIVCLFITTLSLKRENI